MRVCIVAEGCYPFVVGGVSSWVHSLIQLFPETEFVILAIAANRSQRGKYAYELPKNVSAVYELYLDDVDWSGSKKLHRKRLKKEQYQALRSLILDQDIEWDVLFDLFQKENVSLNALLMGEDFLNAVRDCYNLKYSQIVFSDFLWTMRSIYLPLFLTMQTEIPRADLYHCVATGYAGVLGAMAKHFYGSRLLISEHGIYTREREEELIKAKWVEGIYKNIWIDQFRKMSKLAYNEGTLITSLFEHARELQIELGCPIEKTMVTPNGIRVENLQNIPGKTEEDEGKAVCAVLNEIAHVFKGGKGESDCYCGGLDFIALRLEHQKIKHQRQQLHRFLHHRRDLRRGGKGIRLTHRRKEGVDIGREQTHPHPGNAEQEEAELPSAHAQGGHQQGRYHAEEDVFNIGHASTALLVAGNSPRIANVSSRSHQKVGLAGEVSGQKQPAVHSRYSAYTKHSMPM